LGRHHFTEQMNYTTFHVNSTNPLSAQLIFRLRGHLGDRNLSRFSDTFTFGDSGNHSSLVSADNTAMNRTHERRPP